MPPTDAAPLGLRERKRAATRQAIQVATMQLIQERGIDGVTVDEIARVADIAPRTFFNYFPSKDAAVVGDTPALPGGGHVDEFIAARGHILLDLAELLAHTADETLGDRGLVKMRREIIKDHPQVSAMRMATLRHFEEDLVEVVGRRLVAESGAAEDEPTAGDLAVDRSRLITYVAMGAMRAAWIRWADGDDAALADILRAAMREARRELGEPSVAA